MIYGEKIKALRERIGISQKQIADLINVERSAYNHYEKEHIIIAIKHLNTICNYLEVSIDYIFSLSENKFYTNTRQEIDKMLSAQRIKEFRKGLKLTQVGLAKILNVGQSTIAEYERGTNIIATPFLYTICKTYNISADYLLGRIDKPKYLE